MYQVHDIILQIRPPRREQKLSQRVHDMYMYRYVQDMYVPVVREEYFAEFRRRPAPPTPSSQRQPKA